MPRRVEGIQRKALIGPVGKQLDQRARFERWGKPEVEHLRHCMAVFADAVQGPGIVDHQPSAGGDVDVLAGPVEFPAKRPAGLGVAKVDAHVLAVFQILRVGRAAMALKIVRRRQRQHPHFHQLAGNQ